MFIVPCITSNTDEAAVRESLNTFIEGWAKLDVEIVSSVVSPEFLSWDEEFTVELWVEGMEEALWYELPTNALRHLADCDYILDVVNFTLSFSASRINIDGSYAVALGILSFVLEGTIDDFSFRRWQDGLTEITLHKVDGNWLVKDLSNIGLIDEGSWDTVQEAWQKDMVLHSMDTYEFAMRTMDYYRLAQLHAETVYIERGLSTDILSNHRLQKEYGALFETSPVVDYELTVNDIALDQSGIWQWEVQCTEKLVRTLPSDSERVQYLVSEITFYFDDETEIAKIKYGLVYDDYTLLKDSYQRLNP